MTNASSASSASRLAWLAACAALLAISAMPRQQAAAAKIADDSIELEALKQVCANPNGGRLNEPLLLANYERLANVFEDSQPLVELISESREELVSKLAALARKSRKNSAQIDALLEAHTTRLCGALNLVAERLEPAEFVVEV